MDPNWAAENLQTIRTLMERSAIYRRALAPLMITVGAIGLAASVFTCFQKIEQPKSFALFWMGVGLLAIAATLVYVRRQALKSAEAFWSSPTRRVTQALAPGFIVGLAAGVWFAQGGAGNAVWLLPLAWVVLYGCALTAAGFFVQRGIKLFGWGFIIGGMALAFLAISTPKLQTAEAGHYVMGTFFGVLHLAYGGYLFFTERKNET
ncbi:MAG: hypothetical protein AB1705_06515 [Verrucomicrobiota bacterium]